MKELIFHLQKIKSIEVLDRLEILIYEDLLDMSNHGIMRCLTKNIILIWDMYVGE
jgi:hypothetical protein